jgi:hypothetical protein
MRAPTLFSYLSPEEVGSLCKLAEEAAPKRSKLHALKPMLAGAAGMGVGTLAGVGASHLGNEVYKHFKGHSIPSRALLAAAPVVGGGLGLAYNLAQAHQMEAIRRELEDRNDKPQRRVP